MELDTDLLTLGNEVEEKEEMVMEVSDKLEVRGDVSGDVPGIDLTDRDIRQRGFFLPEELKATCALVAGVGAVGHQVALLLSGMGVGQIHLYDPDTVSVENLAPQLFGPDDIGRPKVDVVGEQCLQQNPEIKVHTWHRRMPRTAWNKVTNPEEIKHRVFFMLVDTMDSRHFLWTSVAGESALTIDTRMNSDVLRVITCQKGLGSIDPYFLSEDVLISDSVAHAGQCTTRSLNYGAMIVAGLAVHQFGRYLRNIPVAKDFLYSLLDNQITDMSQKRPSDRSDGRLGA